MSYAEREGFEPSVPLPVRQFSKLILSASQAPLRVLVFKPYYNKSLFFGIANIAISLCRQKKK
jgi:hypothetical protein